MDLIRGKSSVFVKPAVLAGALGYRSPGVLLWRLSKLSYDPPPLDGLIDLYELRAAILTALTRRRKDEHRARIIRLLKKIDDLLASVPPPGVQ